MISKKARPRERPEGEKYRGARSASELGEHRAKVVATVEQILNRGEESVGVLVKSKSVICAGQDGLEISQDGVDERLLGRP